MSCCKSSENGWKTEESEREEECERSVSVCKVYTHYTLMTYFIQPFIYPSISYSAHHQCTDYKTGANEKKGTYLPGLCFVRILNKHTRSLTIAKKNIKKLHVFVWFVYGIHNKGGNATKCMHLHGTERHAIAIHALHWLHLYCCTWRECTVWWWWWW